MPYRDGTGPMGNGPVSGRGRGRCSGGRGGMGQGFGAGRRARFGQPQGTTPVSNDQSALSDQQSFLEAQLASVKRRLAALGGGKETE